MKKTKSQLGRRSRQKGAEFERAVVKDLKALYPKAGRATQWRGGKVEGCDVEGTDFFIECKNCKSLSIKKWFEQMDEDQEALGDKRTQLLVYKRQGTTKARVVMDFHDFLGILTGGGTYETNAV